MIPAAIEREVELRLGQLNGHESKILKFTPSSGGCINHGGKIRTATEKYFVKWNSAVKYPNMFATEANGLALLAASNSIEVPKVIHTGHADELQYIVLSFIDTSARTASYWKTFAEGLATLHRSTDEYFGLSSDNYIGSLPQHNDREKSWVNFFVQQRLERQLEMAQENSGFQISAQRRQFENLYKLLPDLLPEEAPSLVHGDLWAGNIMVSDSGMPVIIDPAVYYGSREVDLAMTRLFGGFDPMFYKYYAEAFPLQAGFQERLELYTLYPLLVHLNLFGQSYLHPIDNILRKYQ